MPYPKEGENRPLADLTRSEDQLTVPKERLTHALEGMCLQYQVSVKLPADPSEVALLKALAELVDEHLCDGPVLDNLCMSAGEQAMALLEEYGLLYFDDDIGRRGLWTSEGRALVNSN